jgi:hypothetical protein
MLLGPRSCARPRDRASGRTATSVAAKPRPLPGFSAPRIGERRVVQDRDLLRGHYYMPRDRLRNGRRGPTTGRFARPRVEAVCRLRRSGVQCGRRATRWGRSSLPGPARGFSNRQPGAPVCASSSTRTSSRIATSSRPRAQDDVHPPRACGGNAWDAARSACSGPPGGRA